MAEDPRRHADVWSLLPLLVNGRATPQQRAMAEAHLRTCPECRADLAREEALAAAFALPPEGVPDAEDGLRRLMERLDRDDVAEQPVPVPARPPRRWATALVVVGVLELALLGVLATGWRPAPEGAYRTLARPEARPADGPRWRVVFDERLTLQDLQGLLQQQGLTVESGPSEAGVFTLVATRPPADADALAAAMRRLPQVRFAEAVPPAR